MPKMGRDAREVRDALILRLRAEGLTFQEIGDDPDVRLSAMSVQRVCVAAAAAEAERRAAEPTSMEYRAPAERPVVVVFTSRLTQWRMRRNRLYGANHYSPEVCDAYWRWADSHPEVFAAQAEERRQREAARERELRERLGDAEVDAAKARGLL